jgi:hypothetical protein
MNTREFAKHNPKEGQFYPLVEAEQDLQYFQKEDETDKECKFMSLGGRDTRWYLRRSIRPHRLQPLSR